MISKIAKINGTQYRIMDDGSREPMPEYYGKSADTKPVVGVVNGQVFYEMDTKGVFMFDGDTNEWLKLN